MTKKKGCKKCGVTLNLNEENKDGVCVSCDAHLSKEKAAKTLVEHRETILDALNDRIRWWGESTKEDRERRKSIQKAIDAIHEAIS